MDIIHRLNPFHRPSSSLSRNTPTPFSSRGRPSSSLEHGYPTPDTTPHPSFDISHHPSVELGRHSLTPTPTFLNTPREEDEDDAQRKLGHRRSHSLLRNLTSHPSLSALKAKSTRGKKKANRRKGIPLMPTDTNGQYLAPVDFGEAERPGTPGKLRKGSLKGSKSLPRDLRFSGEFQALDSIPPLPEASTYDTSALSRSQSSAATSRSGSTSPFKKRNTIRRKPAPSQPPEITVYHDCSTTPESMRVRMRFEVDMNSNYSGSPSRRRHKSFDVRSSSPSENRGVRDQTGRHLSSPPRAQAGPAGDSWGVSDYAFPRTRQHPHPVPIIQEQRVFAQSLYADSTTLFSPGDIVPVTASGRTAMTDEPEDMDPFGSGEESLLETPRKRKSARDLGVSAEHGAAQSSPARVFSRDIYGSPSEDSTSSTSHSTQLLSPTPERIGAHRRAESSPSPGRKSREAFLRAAKRSSSPFEIKLSPHVTRRMSLDAFGTPTAPTFTNPHEKEEGVEELAEYDESFEEEVSWEENQLSLQDRFEDQQVTQVYEQDMRSYDEVLADFQATELSTIMESSSSRGHESQYMSSEGRPTRRSTPPPARPSWDLFSERTQERLPTTPGLSSNGLPLPSPTPTTPLIHKKYASAPPLVGVSPQLLDAHLEHSQSLQDQVKAGVTMMEVLKSEVAEMRRRLSEEREEKEELLAALEEEREEKEELGAFAEGRVIDLEEAHRMSEAKDQALEQLRQVMAAHERALEEIREDKVFYEERCENLEGENEHHLSAKQTAEQSLFETDNENEELKRELRELQDKNDKLSKGKKAADDVVCDLKSELKYVESRLADFEGCEAQLRDAEAEVLELRGSKERAAELGQDVKRQTRRLAEKDGTISTLRLEMSSLKCEILDLAESSQELAASKALVKERDATIASLMAQLADLQNQLTSSQTDAHTDKLLLVTKDQTIDELNEKLRLVRFETNEKHFESQEALGKMRGQVEEATRLGAEREMAGMRANEMLARLMEEKRGWDEEREELYETLNRAPTGEDESASELRSEIQELSWQLANTMRDLQSLQDQLAVQDASLQHKTALITTQETELSNLRHALVDAEDSVAHSKAASERQSKDSERCLERLREQVQELESRLSSHDSALRSAVLEAESGKVSSQDSKWRIERYMADIDELKLSETKLRTQVEELRRQSAIGEFARVDLEKKVGKLEQDKELLNVALESKQMEVVLLQRKEKHRAPTPTRSAPRPTHSALSDSISRIPPTPTPSSGLDHTPLPRRLATSISATPASPRPRSNTVAASRPSSTRIPLGSSTRHNRVSDVSRMAAAGKAPTAKQVEPAAEKGKGVVRRTSLPVLVARPGSAAAGVLQSVNEK
ncbi:hypothetical protein B9479_003499 [Cryptococcus floricola]|uniref:Uncharacterized protein n=1 Tax=Cryptococcus floricola TaxID=2591691 RepID=A0A5D3AWQ4_9TREE|nr:hypothetical protein B9479_003499 [Cryptococcus floricola]